MSFAHGWYQLFDKRGRPYIVEGFLKEWNGIIPVEMLPGMEERIQALVIRHNQVNHFADEAVPWFTESFEDEGLSWVFTVATISSSRKSARNFTICLYATRVSLINSVFVILGF
ncbi:MAG: hypothetical protein IT250_15695 [Chitinophagaceae bacterium]|nr:hypothetical protein [Chitinophagaceae bacterium]